jgi:uncharacterized membrane protein HdeD (DUF308 family)
VAHSSPARPRHDGWVRAIEISLGLVGAGISIVVLANPLVSIATLIDLLAFALAADAVRLLLPIGTGAAWWVRIERDFRATFGQLLRLGRVAIGALVAVVVLAVLLDPRIDQLTLLFLLAGGVVFVSIGRISRAYGPEIPGWLRISSVGTGVIALVLVIVATTYPAIGLATLAVLLAVSMLINSVQSVVWGLRPTDPRQIVLLKLVLF